ncbi:MAG: GNAT family N-acetyltransferase [Pseudomonadota bacterium]
MTDTRTLFQGPGFQARPLTADQVPRLQALFDANPGYFKAINGRPAGPDEAQAEFDELPPPHLPFRQRWVAGVFGPAQQLQGVVVLVADLGAPGVWHLALLLIDQVRQGSGLAAAVMTALQAWAHAGGAQWLRLGVVAGNQRAERFWQRQGFVESRLRHGVHTGGRHNTLRVLVKPLTGGTLADYRHLVPRDCPESPLP